MPMTQLEAAVQLRTTKSLAQHLIKSPFSVSIFPDEAESLIKVLEIIEEGYGDDSQVLNLAGLTWVEYSFLVARLDYHLTRGDDNS